MNQEVELSLKSASAEAQINGLTIPDGVTLDQWAEIGRKLYHAGQSMTWWLADWAAYGERKYGRLKAFCEAHGMNYGSIRQYAYVASSVELSSRLDNLSVSHHAEVASLTKREQKDWLDKCAKHNWSVVELRRRIRESTMLHGPEPTYGPKDEGVELQKLFLDASVIFERKAEFVKENPDECWKYAEPLVTKAAAMWPDRIQVKGD